MLSAGCAYCFAGGDMGKSGVITRCNISTHAALTEGAHRAPGIPPRLFDFNPYLPRGRRQRPRVCLLQVFHISIHTSLAGGDSQLVGQYFEKVISIHTSLAGGDTVILIDTDNWLISIHTSLAGGDYSICRFDLQDTHFNPHLPRGRRRINVPF